MSNLSHNKSKSKLVTHSDLKLMTDPPQLGSVHQPIPHHLLVAALRVEAQERGYDVRREQLALGMRGSAIFGVMDLVPPGVVAVEERGLSIGFRNSTNSTLAVKVVAGTRVFVCDNLALSGDLIALQRRNTRGLDVEAAVKEGFDKFLRHASALDRHVMRMQATLISDVEAKAKVFDAFAQRVIPVHLFDDVNVNYFKPTNEMTDCQPRTWWGLHNAFTRTLKKLGPSRGFASNVALGRLFGMTGGAQ